MKIDIINSNIIDLLDRANKDVIFINSNNPELESNKNKSGVNRAFFEKFGPNFEIEAKNTLLNSSQYDGKETLMYSETLYVEFENNINVINAVPPKIKYGDSKEIELLRKTYKNIFIHADKLKVKTLYIPILSAGSNNLKRMNFKTLFKIAYVAAHNYHVDIVENEKKSSIENVYFVVYDLVDYNVAIDISKKLSNKKSKLNDFSSAKSQVLYLNSVIYHDHFIVMKVVRFMMLAIQYLMPGFWISHLAGYKDWKTKRIVNEIMPIVKITISTIILLWIPYETIRFILGSVMIIDTLYFLSILVVFNDLKKPSVSEGRTLITILLNGIELIISFSLFADLSLNVWQSIQQSFNIVLGYELLIESPKHLILEYWQKISFSYFTLIILTQFLSSLSARKFEKSI